MELSVSQGGWVPSGFVGKLLLGCLHLPCSRASALTRLSASRVRARNLRCMCLVAWQSARAWCGKCKWAVMVCSGVLNEERLNLRLAMAGALAVGYVESAHSNCLCVCL